MKKIIAWLKANWDRVRRAAAVVWLCRFNAFVVLVLFIVFFLVPQGRDLLVGIADGSWWRELELAAAILICAFAGWYWSRVMLYFDFAAKYSPRSIQLVPRALGGLVFLGPILGILWTIAKSDEGFNCHSLWGLEAMLVCGAFFYFWFVVQRRKWKWLSLKQVGKISALNALPKGSWICVGISFVLGIVLITAFVNNPIGTAWIFPATILVFIAGASWIVFGSLVVFISNSSGLPCILFLTGWSMVWGFFLELHEIKAIGKTNPSKTENSWSGISQKFKSWSSDKARDPKQTIPVILVAAEGGGIRAAYWTACVLDSLQDANPSFASHVFAFSGVSGGSLGGAVFTALVAENLQRRGTLQGQFYQMGNAILSNDFLSPTVGALLYPEVIQPLCCGFLTTDRAEVLEKSWSTAWQGTVHSNRFEAPFDELWESADSSQIPSLFLNGTSVEKGNRLIMSNVKIEKDIFHDALGIQEECGKRFSLQTAVDMSTRFTYVSPAGALTNANNETIGHIVDGGYFDNSGALTIYEILQALRNNFGEGRFRIGIILISNDPKSPEVVNKPHGFSQLEAPVSALLGAWNAHSRHSIALLKNIDMSGIKCFPFSLRADGIDIPLGWQLSDRARTNIQRQLLGSNKARFDEISKFLKDTDIQTPHFASSDSTKRQL